jgi:hypothetical protein
MPCTHFRTGCARAKLQRWTLAAGPGAASAPEVEVGVAVAGDLLVALGAHDLLDLLVDEVVEGVDVLAHQAPDLRELVRPVSSTPQAMSVDKLYTTYSINRPERWSK